jgi:uncharacterized membrane protein
MIRWLVFLGLVLAFALASHVAALWAIPYAIMSTVMGRLSGEDGVNRIRHQERATHTSRTIVRPSPDLLYSICAFDIGKQPLLIVSGAPKDTYWSVALYASNTDNFYTINDAAAGGAPVRLVLYSQAQIAGGKAAFEATLAAANRPELAGAIGVASPSATGLVLIRTLVNDEGKRPEIDAARRDARCEPVSALTTPPP